MSDEKEKKLKPLSPAMQNVANEVMQFRAIAEQFDAARAELRKAIDEATQEFMAMGFNRFALCDVGLLLKAAGCHDGALKVHKELNRLRELAGLEMPQTLARGPGSGR